MPLLYFDTLPDPVNSRLYLITDDYLITVRNDRRNTFCFAFGLFALLLLNIWILITNAVERPFELFTVFRIVTVVIVYFATLLWARHFLRNIALVKMAEKERFDDWYRRIHHDD